MKTIKAWLLRWLGAVPMSDFARFLSIVQTMDSDVAELRAALERQKIDSEEAMSELIQELNALRNSIPAAPPSNSRPVRVLRNWKEFRAVIEQPKPVRIERTS